mgnify:FL=1
MSHIVVLGAGLGGLPAAYELRALLDKKHQVTVVNANEFFQFVPSNPWVAVGWRTREQVTFKIEPYLKKKGINFFPQFVKKLDPQNNQLVLKNGETVEYEYLLITTGPRLAFEEVPGTGPNDGFTQSVCTIDHAEKTQDDFLKLVNDPGHLIVGAVQGAS